MDYGNAARFLKSYNKIESQLKMHNYEGFFK